MLKSTILMLLAAATLPAVTSAAEPDRIPTRNGDAVLHPIEHATFVLEWNNKAIYLDPVGGAQRFKSLPRPTLILVTDIHEDHMSAETLQGLTGESTVIIAPKAVIEKLPPALSKRVTPLANGQTVQKQGIEIHAIPMYNLTPDRMKFHAKGRGNGYVLTLGGKRFYVSGDTEDIPEMRALKNIDVAFVCMNLPYTMTVEQAASAVREFKPAVVYPYHYRGTSGMSDVEKFKALVGKTPGIEVRVRDWYPSSENR